jgi:hypothetical protein
MPWATIVTLFNFERSVGPTLDVRVREVQGTEGYTTEACRGPIRSTGPSIHRVYGSTDTGSANPASRHAMHPLPVIREFCAAIKADLAGPFLNREYTAEMPVTAPKQIGEQPAQMSFHGLGDAN